MNELLIINEFSTGSLVTLNGVDDRGCLYHLEPFPTKLKGWQSREFREMIQQRAVEPGSTGSGEAKAARARAILPVCGPFHYQQQILLGWEKREGAALWTSPDGPGEEPRLFRDILGVLSSYRIYHQKGILIGQPVWERVHRDDKGIYFPDPVLVSALAKPQGELPSGLGNSHPPERFRGLAANPAGDIFYLGILIYWLFTGDLPYRIARGWPTRAITAGENIPFYSKRPDIAPAVGALVDRMLAGLPEERPRIEEIEEKWFHFTARDLESGAWRSSPPERARQELLQKAYIHQNKIRFFRKGWRTAWEYAKKQGTRALIPVAALVLIGWVLGTCLMRPTQAPLQIVRHFYQRVAAPTAFFPENEKTVPDYLQERAKRLQAVREIMGKPLVQLSGLKVVSGNDTAGALHAAAELIEWQWNGTGWRRVQRVEYLDLKKTPSGWKIIAREGSKL